jgi:hypothetical protein
MLYKLKNNKLTIVFILVCNNIIAQNINNRGGNTITTGVPFLLINPDAQSTGIGDIGVVAAPGYYQTGLTQNPALLARNEKVIGSMTSYKPWLRNLAPDIRLWNTSVYHSLGKKMSIGYSFNYFSFGEVIFTDDNGNAAGVFRPKEFSGALKLAQSITPNLSLGAGIKYIYSNLTPGFARNYHPATAFAGELGMDYRKEIKKEDEKIFRYDIGASILNIGNKIRYTDASPGEFLPTIGKIGVMFTYSQHIETTTTWAIDIAYQAEKLLVPTPPIYKYKTDTSGNVTNEVDVDPNGKPIILAGKDPNRSVVQGMLGSFNDAPGGFHEELREIVHCFGIENRFTFNEKITVSIRLGHLRENILKGNRKFFMTGLGLKYKSLFIDGVLQFAPNMKYTFGAVGSTYYISSNKLPSAFLSYTITLGYKHSF